MKAEVLKWQTTPELMLQSPLITPHPDAPSAQAAAGLATQSVDAVADTSHETPAGNKTPGWDSVKGRNPTLDNIPLLDESISVSATGVDGGARDVARERRAGDGLDS